MANKKVWRSWAIVFVGLFIFFIFLQIPAAWLIHKFSPNVKYLHNISGNLWKGEADWSFQQLQGTVSWSTRPWELLRLRAASHIAIQSGQTQIQGVMAYGLGKTIYANHMSGQISPETLAMVLPWQWPSTSINVQDVTLHFKNEQGFKSAEGQLSWAGGVLNYPIGQRLERIDIPPLVADLQAPKDNKLQISVRDSQKQRMADLMMGADGMLDVQITQRFLLNAPSYQGKAGLDSTVISTRQPLMSLRGGM